MIKTMFGTTTCLGNKTEAYADMICLLYSMTKLISEEEEKDF